MRETEGEIILKRREKFNQSKEKQKRNVIGLCCVNSVIVEVIMMSRESHTAEYSFTPSFKSTLLLDTLALGLNVRSGLRSYDLLISSLITDLHGPQVLSITSITRYDFRGKRGSPQPSKKRHNELSEQTNNSHHCNDYQGCDWWVGTLTNPAFSRAFAVNLPKDDCACTIQ